jgi:CDP-glucose 4,6-dehydratase
MNREFWQNKKVFVTGHTGFKGGWLSLWLSHLGAKVYGYSLAPPTVPSFFETLNLNRFIDGHIGDIRCFEELKSEILKFKPDIVFHLAAQPILRLSYSEPINTYSTNVMGTANILEAIRNSLDVQVSVIVTTDKCYENKEQIWGYRETDQMGGYDPYSSSKACTELLCSSYARSYFSEGLKSIATARAGNVIGGGDWSPDRLMKDIVLSLSNSTQPIIRSPQSIRPWQHVLDPLSGYLIAAEFLWRMRPKALESWNFGPKPENEATVLEVTNYACNYWGFANSPIVHANNVSLHESKILRLDSTKAYQELGWKPKLNLKKAIEMTINWHKMHQEGNDMYQSSLNQILEYESII